MYREKPIFYGLGNFCFDNPLKRNSIWNEGFMVAIDFSKDGVKYDIIPYRQNDQFVGVKPTKDNSFFEHLKQLNSTIASKEKLLSSVQDFYHNNTMEMIARYQPFSNRVFNKLFRMGIMPSLVSKKRLLAIWNWIECEAHQDNQVYSFKDYLSRHSK